MSTDSRAVDAELLRCVDALELKLRACSFKGYDVYDGLNSPILNALKFNSRYLGIIYVQLMRRSPINFRPLLLTRKGRNPKGIGLVVGALVRKYKRTGEVADLDLARELADWLVDNPSAGYAGACWGYNFNWPSRNAYYPEGTPTIVNTAYISHALLDLFDICENERYRDAALSSGDFILNDLNRTEGEKGFCFSYTPIDQTTIHNASMLGAALLARLGAVDATRDDFASAARESMDYSVSLQREDGSWPYGETLRNRWIDSYHTGYNLLALRDYRLYQDSTYGRDCLEAGYRFYLKAFFTEEGFVKYFHDKRFPFDAHAAAHAVMTLTHLEALNPERSQELLLNVKERIVSDFWNEKKQCFNYKITSHGTNRINYIRWVQMWMYYALHDYLLEQE